MPQGLIPQPMLTKILVRAPPFAAMELKTAHRSGYMVPQEQFEINGKTETSRTGSYVKT